MFIKLRNIFFDNKREPYPDFLRGLAIILMVQVHITELLLHFEPKYQLFERWSYFFGGIPAAPVFVLLMGYFQDKSTSNLKKEILRGISIFFLGLILNILMNLSLIYQYFFNDLDINIFHYLFGVDILIFAGMSYIILAFLRRIIKKNYLFVVIILVVFLINYASNKIVVESDIFIYLLSLVFRISDWSYFPLIPWIAYPLIGILLNRTKVFEKFIAYKFSKFFWIIYFIVLILTIEYGLNSSQNLDYYYKMNFEFFLYSLIILLGWIKFTNTIFEKFSDSLLVDFLKWFGRNVTSVYVFQWIIIGNTATYLYKSLTLNSCLIIFLIVIFSVTICTYLYQLSRS